MLREAKAARFTVRRTLLGRRYALALRGDAEAVWRPRAFAALQAASDREPQPLTVDAERTWWLFERRLWWTDDETLEAHDVLALVRARDRRARRALERAHALLAVEDREIGIEPPWAASTRSRVRRPIPRDVRRVVWERDGGRCVDCGAAFDLQYDHVIPLALGGADTVENLQVLCAPCNQAKGAALS